MFEVHLKGIGRRFNRDWIFKQVDYAFFSGERYAVLGPNGSGKSTLLKVISGGLTPSEGELVYSQGGQPIASDRYYHYISVAAPYLELIEEFTLREMLRFHFKFKAYLAGWNEDRVMEYVQLETSLDKPIRFFSSGMKQRVKLALACFSESHLLLLDEPTSNLDAPSIQWYHQLLEDTVKDRILIIFSNQPEEYKSCTHRLKLERAGY